MRPTAATLWLRVSRRPTAPCPARPRQIQFRGNGNDGRAGDLGSDGEARPKATAASKPSRHGLKNWRVRSRLLLLISIPTLTAIAFGAISVSSSVQTALTYNRVQQLASLNSDLTTLVQRLQDERDQTAYFIAQGGQASQPARLRSLSTQRNDCGQAAAQVTGLLSRLRR